MAEGKKKKTSSPREKASVKVFVSKGGKRHSAQHRKDGEKEKDKNRTRNRKEKNVVGLY